MIPTIQIPKLKVEDAISYLESATAAVRSELLGELAATILGRQARANDCALMNWEYLAVPDLIAVYRTAWALVEDDRRVRGARS